MICETCGNEFYEDWRKDSKQRKKPLRFCSKSCSNSFSTKEKREEINKKVSSSLKGRNTSTLPRERKFCVNCNKELYRENKTGYCKNCKKKNENIEKNCKICFKKLSQKNKTGYCYNCKTYYHFPELIEVSGEKFEEEKRKVKNKRYFKGKRYKFRKRKLDLINYKGGKCEICGYDKCPRALEFHHKDKNKKDFNISHSYQVYRSLEEDKNEADKCILVCANCHREIHHEEEMNKEI